MAQRKGVKQQAVEKKISVLEKALEHHPRSLQLMLMYLEACSLRDTVPEMLAKWEKAVILQSGSYHFWKEFLLFVCSQFSVFSVPTVRAMYVRALGALTAARDRLVSGVPFFPPLWDIIEFGLQSTTFTCTSANTGWSQSQPAGGVFEGCYYTGIVMDVICIGCLGSRNRKQMLLSRNTLNWDALWTHQVADSDKIRFVWEVISYQHFVGGLVCKGCLNKL
jgi:hypothetical protein